MNIKHSIGLNLSAYAIPCRLHMVQGDSNSRTIVATLWDGAEPYSVPDESSVMIRFRKPDGTGGLYDSSEAGEAISYAGNVVTAPVATQMLAVAGDVFAEIDIFGSGSGTAAERLATFRFVVEVAPCVLPDAEIISSDYYNVLAAKVAEAVAAADQAEQAKSDAAASAAAAATSAADAATSAEGAVKFTVPQTLTEAQKQQARDNIGAEVFYIDLAGDYPDYTCPVAMADIKAAYEAGKVLECRCRRGKSMAVLPLFIPMPELGIWIFSGSGQLTTMQVPAQAFTIAITPNGVLVDMALLATTEDKLPNPYALTITSGGTTVTYDGSMAESIDIPAVCNANLLDNWCFGNPVNQRGASGTISTAGYFFDRWKLVSGSVTINSGAIVLNGTIAQVREYAVGQAVTATVLTPDGVTDVTPVYDDEAKTFTVTAQGKTIRAVKLELGTQQTLAHQENGVWVLNEIPDYVEQLRKCQRYLYVQSGSMMVCGVLTGSKKSLTLAIPVPAPMRRLPSLEGVPSVSGVRTIQGTNMAAEITSGAVLASTALDTDIAISLNTETFNTAEYINNTPIVCYISNVMLSAEL